MECDDTEDVDELVFASSTFTTMDRAKALALHGLAYGQRCRVVDLVTGQNVFPRDEVDVYG